MSRLVQYNMIYDQLVAVVATSGLSVEYCKWKSELRVNVAEKKLKWNDL